MVFIVNKQLLDHDFLSGLLFLYASYLINTYTYSVLSYLFYRISVENGGWGWG